MDYCDKTRTQNDLVSIIIPVHDVQKAGQCVKALELQTYKAIEIIQVKFRGFPAEKRNYGFKKSNGAFVLFLDEDEYLSPTVVEECVEKAKEGYDLVSIPVRKRIGNGYRSQCIALIREGTFKAMFFQRDTLCRIGLLDPEFVLSDDVEIRERAARDNCTTATIGNGYIMHDETVVSVTSIIRKTILGRRPFRKLKEKYGSKAFKEIVRSDFERRRILKGIMEKPKYAFGVFFIMLARAMIRRIP
jgi:glycosyltransferase involved in cell wall biosynthesis